MKKQKIDMHSMSDILIPMIAEGKAGEYSPICVYGDQCQVSHFCDSVLLACDKVNPNMSVCRFSADLYTDQLILSIINGYRIGFHKSNCAADMLVFTEIDLLQGRNGTLEEFYYMFNSYYMQNKMIVIGSSVPYKDLSAMEDRVLAQLQGGLTVKLES